MTSKNGRSRPPGVGGWHFASLVVIVIAGGVLVWASFEVFAGNKNADKALAIIGAVLPSVVAMAGAVFGVSAFKVGTASGAESGEARAAVAESEREQVQTKSVAVLSAAITELGNAKLAGDQPQAASRTTADARERLIQLRDELNG